MEAYINNLIFGLFPYIATAICMIGVILRFDRDPYTWRTKSSQMLKKKNFAIANNLFHVGVICLFMGHFVGLLTPAWLYHALGLTAATKQLVAMIAGGVFGTLCFVGLTMLIWRRLSVTRIRETSSFMDIALLFVLLAQLILGLMSIPVSAQHLDGSSMIAVANWAQYIATFRSGAADFVADIHWIFKAHIFLGLCIFVIFPFTRLVHMLSAPLGYAFRQGYQIVRKRS